MIPLELKLLAWLRIAENWGLNRIRIFGLLWPAECFSLLQLDKRLEQLVLRLRRTHKLRILTKNDVLYLHQKDYGKVGVFSGGYSLPRLLRKRPRPTAKEVSEFYTVSRSSAFSYMAQWKKDGLIE